MKTFRTIAVLVLAVLLCAPVLAFGNTDRLGASEISFNRSKYLAKSAAYTITTSDNGAEVGVTCSSANIAITLPSVESATASGTFRVKIKKADATTYTVTATPATGDTVGFESTRVLNYQNAYMVLHTGTNNNWEVEYESPYIAADYEAGTVTFYGIGSYTSDTVFGGTTPLITIGDAGAEDAAIKFDGNAVDFSFGLDDSVDKLTLSKDSVLGTTNILAIANTPTTITVHDASAADATVVFDGNAVDFGLGLDDSADKFVLGKDSALGTTPILAISNTPTTIVIHDASAADATLTLAGNAVNFSFGLDDSADAFALSKGTALGTTNILSISNTPTTITVHDTSAADATVVLAGNAVTFGLGLDDSGDTFVLGKGATLGTTPILTVSNTPTSITIHDASAADATITLDGNAVDFGLGLDDSADTFVLGKGGTLGTTPIMTISNTPTSITLHDASEADATLAINGNAQDFYACLDDSADDLVIGVGATCGTTPAISVDDTTLVIFATSTRYTPVTVASLTACAAGNAGETAYITFENSLCFCNGSNYIRTDDGTTCTDS